MGTSELLPYLNLHLGEHLHLCQIASQLENRRMPNGTYGGVRGRKTKVGRKLLRFPPTRLKIHLSSVFARGHEESKASLLEHASRGFAFTAKIFRHSVASPSDVPATQWRHIHSRRLQPTGSNANVFVCKSAPT